MQSAPRTSPPDIHRFRGSSGAKGRKAAPGGLGSTEGTGICEARRVHLTFNNNKWNYATTNTVEMNAIIASASVTAEAKPSAAAAA